MLTKRIPPLRTLFLCRRISGDVSRPAQPLNVLFFGSDTFSNFSLQALNELRQMNGNPVVGKIQVVTRSPKWCGRQKSVLKYPPIFDMASKLQLPRPITCDTKQDMLALGELTSRPAGPGAGGPFNAIIAVSFGKLIPGDLVRAVPLALNVHPSLLPRHKGSAPIQRALLEGDLCTGVTVQTLHPDRFDHGAIVAQTQPLAIAALLRAGRVAPPHAAADGLGLGLGLPRRTAILLDQLGAHGAQLLKQTLCERLYLPQNRVHAPATADYEASYARRITTEDKRIHWVRDSAAELLNRLETLGPLHAFKEAAAKGAAHPVVLKRVLLHECSVAEGARLPGCEPGTFEYDQQHDCLFVACRGGSLLCVSRLQFEGFAIERAGQFVARLQKRCGILSQRLVFQ